MEGKNLREPLPIRIADFVLSVGAVAAEIVLAMLVIMVTVEVSVRSLFGYTIGIVDELMGYFLVAIVFFGLGKSIKDGALLRVDVFINMLGPRAVRNIDRLFALVGVVVMTLYLRELWVLVSNSFRRGTVSGSAVAIPQWIPQSALAIGSFLAVVGFLVLVFRPAEPSKETDLHQ